MYAWINQDNDSPEEENNWMSRIREYREELARIKENSAEIYQTLEFYHLNIVEEEFRDFQASVKQTEEAIADLTGSEKTDMKNKFIDLYEITLQSYTGLVNLYDFYNQLQDKKEEWSNTYFYLWEQTYDLKTRVDKMYVKEEKMNVHYGGMDNYKYQSVRKRNLYEACIEIYNTGLLNLKATGDCEHYKRILILEEIIPVLRKCEKLSFSEDTRALEKDLKKVEDAQAIADMILNFQE
jgi:hypothetical protein